MKTIRTLFVLGLFGWVAAFAQSNLPPCQGTDPSNFTHCHGTVTYTNSDKYVGEFKEGKRNGQGTLTYADGDKYVGEWGSDRRHGQGTFTNANGEKYVGEFNFDKRHGQGITIYPDNRSPLEGIWENNKFIRAQKINHSIPEISMSSKISQKENIESSKISKSIQENKINDAKQKCSNLGFKPKTEGHGKCVLQLSK